MTVWQFVFSDTARDWGRVILGSLISALVVAWFTTRLNRRRFISERWWERKASAYGEVMEQLARLKMAVLDCIDELGDEEPEQEEWNKYVAQWDRAAEALGVLANQDTFLLSSEARGCLQYMHTALAALGEGGAPLPKLKSFVVALHEGIEQLARFAHEDLEVAKRR